LPYFLDASATEAYICRVCELTPEQVAAARAHILNNPETVLAEHRRIEARIAAGNAPQVIERAEQTRAAFLTFKKWLATREQATARDDSSDSALDGVQNRSEDLPTFREWLAKQESRPVEGP